MQIISRKWDPNISKWVVRYKGVCGEICEAVHVSLDIANTMAESNYRMADSDLRRAGVRLSEIHERQTVGDFNLIPAKEELCD